MQENEGPIVSSNSTRGRHVRNLEGEGLGNIEDLAIDLDTARVAYVVLSIGGFLGIGDRQIGVPLEAFELDPDSLEFILDADRATLENAPRLKDPDTRTISDRAWREQVYAHFGTPPYWHD